MTLKVEEKGKRNQDHTSKNRGRGRHSRGDKRGGSSRGGESRNEGERRLLEKSSEISTRGSFGRGRGSQGNIGRGAGRSSSYFATMKCYQCGQLGHPAYTCLDKPSTSSSEKRVAYAQEDGSSSCTNEVSKLELDMGEKLMIRNVLMRQPNQSEPKQRRALFRVKCKIKGKVCKLIVDSGYIDNIISEEATKKLKLTKVPHENPYKVTWLNQEQSVLVNEQTWVEFSIGAYKDKVLCDVLPMDACHLLLGRPWKFDRKVI